MVQSLDFIRIIALQLALLKGNVLAQHMLQPASFTCVARTVFGEARGEGVDGMALVAQSIVNRRQIKSRSSCVIAKKSYDGYRAMHGKSAKEMDHGRWMEAQLVSVAVIMGEYDLGECSDVTHFINPRKVSRMPSWANKENRICSIGNHVAYRVANI